MSAPPVVQSNFTSRDTEDREEEREAMKCLQATVWRGRGVIAMEGRAVGPLTCVPSNALSSAMDLNFDRFFQTIFSPG